MVKGFMKLKNFAAFALLAALISMATPAASFAAAATSTGTITVKWNTQATATLLLHTGYTTTFAHSGVAAPIKALLNGGAGACSASDPTNTDLTVDFGNVSPDSGANVTDCLEVGSQIASVVTNSTNWTLTEAATGGYPASTCSGNPCFLLCGYADNGATAGKHGAFPVTTANITGGTVPSSATAANAVTNAATTACAADAGNAGIKLDGTGGTLVNGTSGGTVGYTTGAPAYIGMDIELLIAGNAPTGQQTVTETATLTAN